MDFNTLHKQRKFVLIAALVGVIAMFLPFVSVPKIMGFGGGSVNGMHGNGVLMFLGFIASGVLAFLGNQQKAMAKNNWLGVLGAGALIVLFWLINLLRGNAGLDWGIGFWLCIVAAGGVLASAYLFRDPNQDLKQSLNEMKKQVENKLDNNPNT